VKCSRLGCAVVSTGDEGVGGVGATEGAVGESDGMGTLEEGVVAEFETDGVVILRVRLVIQVRTRRASSALPIVSRCATSVARD